MTSTAKTSARSSPASAASRCRSEAARAMSKSAWEMASSASTARARSSALKGSSVVVRGLLHLHVRARAQLGGYARGLRLNELFEEALEGRTLRAHDACALQPLDGFHELAVGVVHAVR